MARAGRGCIEKDQYVGVAQPSDVVTPAQGGVLAAEKRIGDRRHGDSLPGVAEYLRPGDQQDVIVRVAGHRSLVGGFERPSQRFAEIHAEVGEVLDDDGVVPRGQLADRAQLVLREADPRRIVGVRVDDGRHVACGEDALNLRPQLFAPVIVDVERLRGNAENAHLTALHGESGVDEEDFAPLRVELRAEQECGEAALHRPDGGDAAPGGHLYVEEGFQEARRLRLEFRNAEHVGILRRDARLQGRAFGLDARPFGRQPRHAHFEVEELHARVALHRAGDVARLADRGLRDVGYVHPLQRGAQAGPVERYFHGFVCFWAAS